MKKYLTREGLDKLKEELKHLKEVKRREISERLEKCIAFGDLAENSEYHETKEAQAFLEGRILELEDLINNAIVVEGKQKIFAQVGSTVLVGAGLNKEKFILVGAEEADPLEGKISVNSPLGKAILNQAKDATIEVQTPQGQTQYKILKIE